MSKTYGTEQGQLPDPYTALDETNHDLSMNRQRSKPLPQRRIGLFLVTHLGVGRSETPNRKDKKS